jgi:hypothetical protein
MSHADDNPRPIDLDAMAERAGGKIDPKIRAAIIAEVERYTDRVLKEVAHDWSLTVAEGIRRGMRVHEGQHHPMTGPDGQMDAHSYRALVDAIGEEIDRKFERHLEDDHVAVKLSELVDSAVSTRFERYGDLFIGLNRFERVEAKVDQVVGEQYDTFRNLVAQMLDERLPRVTADIEDAIDAEIETLSTGEEGEASA